MAFGVDFTCYPQAYSIVLNAMGHNMLFNNLYKLSNKTITSVKGRVFNDYYTLIVTCMLCNLVQ